MDSPTLVDSPTLEMRYLFCFLCKLIRDFVLYKVVNEKHLIVDMIVVVNKYTELIKYM